MTKLFSASFGVAELLRHAKEKLGLVKGDNVVQLIHKGNPIRVIMTQEHYLNLLDKLREREPAEKRQFLDEKEMANVLEELRRDFEKTPGKEL